MTILCLVLLTTTHTASSLPVSYHTRSNPAFTAYYGRFHVFIEPRDVGDISVFSCSGRFQNWGLAFSNQRAGIERRNWLSTAHHFEDIPLSAGMNAGICKVYDRTDALWDLGVWLQKPLSVGIIFSNMLGDDKILRGGISYTWRFLTATVEIEDSLRSGGYVPHGLVTCELPYRNFVFSISGGFYPDTFSAGLGVEYRRFITAQLFYEGTEQNSLKALIGIHFRPPVVYREIAVVETMTVKEPVIVEKTIVKKEPSPLPEKPPELTAQQIAYCEEHYMKGIEYYVTDKLNDAIHEWTLVTNVDPDYKDVERYLENARAKKELLEN